VTGKKVIERLAFKRGKCGANIERVNLSLSLGKVGRLLKHKPVSFKMLTMQSKMFKKHCSKHVGC